MSSELRAYLPTGSTLYAVLINSAGQLWNTSGTPAFEAYNGANWTDYDIALTEAGAGLYFGNMPAAVAGNYSYVVYERAGASPATTDSINGMGTLSWDGSAEVGLSTIAGRLPSSLTANGNMKSSLVEILTTALTETSGLIAGAFKKFFNVADPTGNVNSLPEFAAGNNGGVFLQGGNMAATTVYFNDESNLDTKLTTLAALAATSLPNATAGSAGGLAIVGSSMDMGSISGDSAAADNLEAMLDGTGGVDLDLKQLHLTGAAGPGLLITSSAVGGGAVKIQSTAVVSGIGIDIDASGGGSIGIDIDAVGTGASLAASASDGTGLQVAGGSGSGAGIGASGSSGINAIGTANDIIGDITGNLSGSVGSLATQAKADVNTEIVDALNVDTYAEPGQGAPGATISLAAKIGYLYKSWRNKKTQTATAFKLYNDAGDTVDQKSTVSDDATTATKGEIGTGP